VCVAICDIGDFAAQKEIVLKRDREEPVGDVLVIQAALAAIQLGERNLANMKGCSVASFIAIRSLYISIRVAMFRVIGYQIKTRWMLQPSRPLGMRLSPANADMPSPKVVSLDPSPRGVTLLLFSPLFLLFHVHVATAIETLENNLTLIRTILDYQQKANKKWEGIV